MRGGFRISCVRPSSRRTLVRQLSSGRVAVGWAMEQGEPVVAARSRSPMASLGRLRVFAMPVGGLLQRGPEKLITDGYRAIFECVVRGFVVTRRIQEDIGPWLIVTIVRHRRHRAGWSARGHRAAPPLPQHAVAESGRSFRP
jgi:hypothetical protein